MAHFTAIAVVRSLIGDNNKIVLGEVLTLSGGSPNQFQTNMFPIRTGTLAAKSSGTAQTVTGNLLIGLIDFTGATGITAGSKVTADYQYNALSDDEITVAIDLASGAGNMQAGAIAARQLAGNFGRFFAYTQGDKTVDKSKMGKNLLDLAKSLEDGKKELDLGAGTSITIATADDSGTAFDGYDTGQASLVDSGIC